MDIFTVLFYQPIFNLLVVLYRLFSENLGLAIIVLALLSRIITLPITIRQMRSAASGKEMQAKVNEIKKKYKNDKEKQQQEMMKVQSEYLPGQLAGCLPVILQLILFINVYNVINNLIAHGIDSFNKVAYGFVPAFDSGYHLNTSFLGLFDLKTAASHFQITDPQIIPYIIIVILVGVTQYFSTKYMMNGQATLAQNEAKIAEEGKKDKKSKSDKKKDPDAPEDFSSILQQSSKQTMLLLPILFGLFSYNVASGLGFYWIAQSSFVIIQQFVTKQIKKRKTENSVV